MNIQSSLDTITFVILVIVTLFTRFTLVKLIWPALVAIPSLYGFIDLIFTELYFYFLYGFLTPSNQYESLLFFAWEITFILIGFKELGKTRIFLIVGSVLICNLYLYPTHDLINLNLLP